MEPAIRTAAARLVDSYHHLPPGRDRLLVGIVGAPGSGKSELAMALAEEVRRLRSVERSGEKRGGPGEGEVSKEEEEEVIVIGMDGWHYSRAELDLFPDPADAHARRGAHDTFDARSFVSFVKALRSGQAQIEDVIVPIADQSDSFGGGPSSTSAKLGETIPPARLRAPSFSHALKDPLPDTIHVHPTHRIILIEGLYVALDLPPWNEAGTSLDEIVLIEVDESVARGRIVRRHLAAGLARTEEEAGRRADENDLPNGRFLMSKLLPPTIRIRSVDDPKLSRQ